LNSTRYGQHDRLGGLDGRSGSLYGGFARPVAGSIELADLGIFGLVRSWIYPRSLSNPAQAEGCLYYLVK
jgi:hypothetical protein